MPCLSSWLYHGIIQICGTGNSVHILAILQPTRRLERLAFTWVAHAGVMWVLLLVFGHDVSWLHGAVKVCEGAMRVPAIRPLHFKHNKKQKVSGGHSQLSFFLKIITTLSLEHSKILVSTCTSLWRAKKDGDNSRAFRSCGRRQVNWVTAV